MLNNFLNLFRQKPTPAAPPSSWPDWFLQYSGAHHYDVPEPETYEAQANLLTKVSYLFSAVMLKSEAAAAQDFDIYENGKEIKDHPLELLMKSPNPLQTGFEFLRDHYVFISVTGSSFWWINAPTGKEPAEIWLIPPGNIKPVPDDKLGIKEYCYYPGDGQEIALPPDQIIWFRGFHPTNQFASMSAVMPLSNALWTDIETQKYLRTVYGPNMGRLPGIIAFAQAIGNDDWKKIKQDIKQASVDRNYMMLRGVGQGGVQWIQAAATIREMETMQGREMTREEIYNAIAPGLLNMTAVNATEANSKTGKATFAEFTLFPLLTGTAQKINKDLIWRYGKVTLEFDDPRVSDRQLELAEIQEYSKYFKINEVRVNKYQEEPLPADDPTGEMYVSQVGSAATAPTQEAQPGEILPTAQPAMQAPAELPGDTTTAAPDPLEMLMGKELANWQDFEAKREGKAHRDFETQYIPPLLATRIRIGLKAGRPAPEIFAAAASDLPAVMLAMAINRTFTE